ncbi:MAG: multidrug transporter [Chloroflexi bacterium]|nr:multidrug transporter [Chloroflexota bacterium]
MRRYIIEDERHVLPFNQPASLLTVGVKPLKLLHEELCFDYFKQALSLGQSLHSREEVRNVEGECIVYRDSLWFDTEFLDYFMERARKTGKACRAALSGSDPAFRTYVLPLSTNFEKRIVNGEEIYLADLWYFPRGYSDEIAPIIVPSESEEMGFYSVPDFMTMEQGNLTHYGPSRALISIESWVHVYFAAIIFSLYGRASRYVKFASSHNFFQLRLLWRAIMEQNQLLSTSAVVTVGKGTSIHPTAVITGPASIGENCNIGPGVFIDNCTIGDNVTIDDNCALMMSSVGDRCFLPFNGALYHTAVMENTIIAQNTCLQMCVIGRNSFVGAGNTFTDFTLLEQKKLRAANINGDLETINQIVLGGAVGHNCRIGSGLVFYPGRMVESDVVLIASPQRRVIMRSIPYEESDHHTAATSAPHQRHYPRQGEQTHEEDAWDTW